MLIKKIIAGPTRVEINIDDLNRFLSGITNATIKTVTRASESYTNEVYKINLSTNETIFLKFFDDEFDSSRGRAELKAMNEARNLGVPVPEILISDFSKKYFKRDVVAFKALNGNVITEINQKIITNCLDTLTRLHSLKSEDYGFKYLPQEHWEKGNCYFDFLEDVIVYGLKKLQKNCYPIDGLYEIYSSYAGRIKEGGYCFNHNDFTLKHIFVKDDEITGVIDWEWNVFANPINDYTAFVNSLIDEGVPKSIVKKTLEEISRRLDNYEELDFYMGRRFLLGAMFPHKNKLSRNFIKRKLLFGRALLKKEITFEDFVNDIYNKSIFS